MPFLLPPRDLTYERFAEMMNDEQSSYIRIQIEEFMKSFMRTSAAEGLISPSKTPPPPSTSSSEPPSADQGLTKSSTETPYSRQMRRGREYRRILESFAVVLLKDPFWQLQDPTNLEPVSEDSEAFEVYVEILLSFLEMYIAPGIYRSLFVRDQTRDWELTVRCQELEWLRPANLDLPLFLSDLAPIVELCTSHFTNMAFEKLPSAKSKHLVAAWKLLERCLNALGQSASPSTQSASSTSSSATPPPKLATMDDIMPLLVYIVVKSRPPQIYSDLVYLSATSREMSLNGSFISFYVTNTLIAIEFIRTLTLEKLSNANEQNLRPGRLAAVLAAPPPPTVKEKAQSAISELWEPLRGRVKTAVEKVTDSVTSTVSRVSQLPPVLAVTTAVMNSKKGDTSIIPSTEAPENSVELSNSSHPEALNTQGEEESQKPINEIVIQESKESGLMEENFDEEPEDDGEWTKTFKYFHAKPEELTLDQIRELLEDYKELARYWHSEQDSESTEENQNEVNSM